MSEVTNAAATYFLPDMSKADSGKRIHKPLPFRGQPHRWCVGNGTKHPRHVTDDVRDHEHVVRIMMVGRGDVDPTTTGQ